MNPNHIKITATGAAVAGTLVFGALGLGAGLAHAAPGNPGPTLPPVPGPVVPGNPGVAWTPGMPPGQNPLGPPGQVMKMPTVTVPGIGEVANPYYGVPPGHWDDPGYLNPQSIVWIPPGFPNLTQPLNLVWNAATNAWGVFVNDVFVPYPVALPGPGR